MLLSVIGIIKMLMPPKKKRKQQHELGIGFVRQMCLCRLLCPLALGMPKTISPVASEQLVGVLRAATAVHT